jgi:hypothetical protein
VDDAIDADLRAPADARALKDFDACCKEALIADRATLERRMRSSQDVVDDLDRVPARAADVEVLASHPCGGNRRRSCGVVRRDVSADGEAPEAGCPRRFETLPPGRAAQVDVVRTGEPTDGAAG